MVTPSNIVLPLGQPRTNLLWTVWPPARDAQKHVAHGGVGYSGTFAKLCKWVEDEHKNGLVYAKGRGPQWSPVGSADGHRCVESTTSVQALTLDCDGAGTWDQVLDHLDEVGVAYLAYESSGCTPDLPKWRLVLPMTQALLSNGNASGANQYWHGVYHVGRVVIGALAGFAEPVKGGFDVQTCSIANVFYLGHRRDEHTPHRRVRWQNGMWLDAAGLAAMIPTTTSWQDPSTWDENDEDNKTPFKSWDLTAPASKRGGIPGDTPVRLHTGSMATIEGVGATLPAHGHTVSCDCPLHEPGLAPNAAIGKNKAGAIFLRCWGDCGGTYFVPTASVAEVEADKRDVENVCADLDVSYDAEAVAKKDQFEQARDQWGRAIRDLHHVPVAHLEARVLARKEKADKAFGGRVDLDVPDNLHPVLAAVQGVVRLAKGILSNIRDDWKKRGYKVRLDRCGSLPQGLLNYQTADGLHVGRLCGDDRCSYCGPWRVALRIAAILHMPATRPPDKDHPEYTIVGVSLIWDDVYLYAIPASGCGGWEKAWHRASDEAAQKTDFCNVRRIRKGPKVSITESTDTQKSENQARPLYVRLSGTSRGRRRGEIDYYLSSVQVPGYKHVRVVPPDELPRLVERMVTAIYRPHRDEAGIVCSGVERALVRADLVDVPRAQASRARADKSIKKAEERTGLANDRAAIAARALEALAKAKAKAKAKEQAVAKAKKASRRERAEGVAERARERVAKLLIKAREAQERADKAKTKERKAITVKRKQDAIAMKQAEIARESVEWPRTRKLGRVSSCDALTLSPQLISKMARPDGWCVVRHDLCHPSKAHRRLTGKMQHAVVLSSEGIVTAIQMRRRTQEGWDETWNLLRRDQSDEQETAITATTTVVHQHGLSPRAESEMDVAARELLESDVTVGGEFVSESQGVERTEQATARGGA